MSTREAEESQVLKDLRKQQSKDAKRADVAEAKLKRQAFQLAGVDPDKGVGKLLFAQYEGDEFTAKEVTDLFSENEVALPKSDKDDGDDPTPVPGERTDAEKAAAEAQAKIDGTLEASGPNDPPTPQAKIAKAEADGDWREAIALKNATLAGKPNA